MIRILFLCDDESQKEVFETTAGGYPKISAHVKMVEDAGKGADLLGIISGKEWQDITHVLVLEYNAAYTADSISNLLAMISDMPDVMIIGPKTLNKTSKDGSFSRWAANFWLRLQTGVTLKNASGRVRVYPFYVLRRLKLRQKGTAFHTEVLVKSVWAGVRIQEADIPCSITGRKQPSSFLHQCFDATFRFILNIHFSGRSVMPVPHRKILEDPNGKKKNISFLHPVRSIKMLLKENATPKQLAAAGMAGVFFGTFPLFGFHTVIVLFASSFFRLNKVAALSANQLCMPPFVPALCVETGFFLRHGHFLTDISLKTLGYEALERIYEWLLGSLVMAPVLGVLAGGIIYVIAVLIKQNIPVSQE